MTRRGLFGGLISIALAALLMVGCVVHTTGSVSSGTAPAAQPEDDEQTGESAADGMGVRHAAPPDSSSGDEENDPPPPPPPGD